jgi:mono/diheme cytochrome c family protein
MPAALAGAALGFARPAIGQPAQKPGAVAPPFVAEHCVACHGRDVQKGDFRLDDLSTDFGKPEVQDAWRAARDRVAAGTMPPAKRPKSPAAAASAFVAWVDDRLAAADRARQASEGRVPLRRLNRAEYENTVRDLLGVGVGLKDMLPADGLAHGFDNIAGALSVSPDQMQRYLEAAEVALDAAVARGPRPEPVKRTVTLAEGRAAANIGKHWLKRPDGAVVVFTSATFPSTQFETFRAAARGRYRLTVRGYAYQSQTALPFALYTGNFGRGGDTRLHGYYDLPAGRPGAVEVSEWLEPGDSFQVLPFGLSGFPAYKKDDSPTEGYPGSGLALLGVEVEGPLADEWPTRGHRLLFGDLPLTATGPAGKGPKGRAVPAEVVSTDPPRDAGRLLPGFLSKALRRPVTAAQVEPYLTLFADERKGGATFREAMLTAASAALCSPDFLFLRETPGRLDDHALAARLSYFLWRTMPDDELARVAAAGALGRPAVLREQTERLLRHPNAARFTVDFTDAWLNLREIDATTPDKLLYPEFDDLLQDSMVKETRAFFDEVVGKNLPAGTFLASDFAMLNGRLATHYRVPGVEGLAVRRVPLPAGSPRGGLLTQGAVLKVSANGTNTSPVVRGVYVLERFLGTTPSPPPPGVPAVEPDIRGAKTVRELLDKHRSVETCAGCHRLIDPPGFALERFDVIGGWRDRFRAMPEKPGKVLVVDGQKVRYAHGQPVDAAGELTDGRAFRDFGEFRALLAADPERFARCLTEKLLAFATGREPGPADRPGVDAVLAPTAGSGYATRDLIHAVVQSETFRTK